MTISTLTAELCAVCGAPLGPDSFRPYGVCGVCITAIHSAVGPFTVPLESVTCVAATEYGGTVTAAIEAFKLRGNRRLGPVLGEVLRRTIASNGDASGGTTGGVLHLDAVVPIPPSPRGRRRRGFDQTAYLASFLQIPTRRLLARNRGNEQKNLDRRSRARNADARYRPGGTLRRGGSGTELPRRVVLIDDVVTTGASVARCAAILHDHGIECEYAFVCAAKR